MEDFEAKYKKRIETLSDTEKGRKEQHGTTRIIYNREISPIQMFQNVIDNTAYVFKNRVPEEGSRVIKSLKGVGGQRRIGIIIQWLGLLIFALFVIYGYNFKSLNLNESLKNVLDVIMIIFGSVLIILGGAIRGYGRKYMADYLDVWNPIKAPIEINRLNNGQLVVARYLQRNKECSRYLSALNPDDTEWIRNTIFNRTYIPSYIDYMYIIDSVKSCTRTKNGLMIESSGRCYGTRVAYHTSSGHSSGGECYLVFAETQISYRKEEIPAIFTNLDQLEASLMSYKDYQLGRDAFVPY